MSRPSFVVTGGALPYATAKAAVEGLTRAVAVDHGPAGIRTNAVALGSISTARYEAYRAQHPEVDAQMAALHPLGRVGTSSRRRGVPAVPARELHQRRHSPRRRRPRLHGCGPRSRRGLSGN